jgi:hypothetical protein
MLLQLLLLLLLHPLLLLLPGVLNTNMWGMAMAGADICGFADMTQVGRVLVTQAGW